MTDDLHTLLQVHADQAELARPDIGAITTAGRQQIRRRRVAAGIAVVATAVVLAGVGLTLPSRTDTSTPAERPDGRRLFLTHCGVCANALSWVQGSTLHEDHRTTDLGHNVSTYVRTMRGYAFVGENRLVYSVVDGRVTGGGSTARFFEQHELVADPGGSLVAWMDDDGQRARLEVLDQRTSATVGVTGGRLGASASDVRSPVIAVDGDTVYWQDGVRTVQTTLGDGTTTTGDVTLPTGWQLVTVGAGIAVEQETATGRTTVGRIGSGTTWPITFDGRALVSPSGTWVATGQGAGKSQTSVYSAGSGRRVVVPLRAWAAVPYAWLDDDRLAVLVARTESSPYAIWVCSVSGESCGVAQDGVAPQPGSGGANQPVRMPDGSLYYSFLHG